MTGIFASANSGQRKTWAWVFVALLVYWVALIYQLGAQWLIYEQYNYGWSVPFLCAFLVWQRISDSKILTANCQLPAPSSQFLSSILYFLLSLCVLLYAPTRFFHEANPIWRLTSLLWAIEVIIFTLILLHFAFQSSSFTLHASHFVFPVGFFLVAVPWPSGLESFMVQTLTRLNVSATVEVLGWFGIPAIQHANVIQVATGQVGVDDACSGIRSFQATLTISLFFGQIFKLSVMRRALCVVAGFALSFLFNLARTTLLTSVAAKKGVAAVASWHDPAGVTILVLCFLTLWLTAVWLRGKGRKQKARSSEEGTEVSGQMSAVSEKSDLRSPPSAVPVPSTQPSTVRWLTIALLGWFVLVEAGVEWWYRSHETAIGANQQWTLNPNGLGSGFAKVEIPPDILAQFRADESMEGRWRNEAGNFWQLYYFRWFPAHALNKQVAIQLAKSHGPAICLPAIGMILQSDLGVITMNVGDRQFTFRQYVFLADDHPLHVFYAIYEDPSGTAVLANRRRDTMSRIKAALAGSRNDGQRFLEIAVTGPGNPEQAKIALRAELERLIVSQP